MTPTLGIEEDKLPSLGRAQLSIDNRLLRLRPFDVLPRQSPLKRDEGEVS